MYIPEMALATTNRWISLVPSKMVKILRGPVGYLGSFTSDGS
ncbi:hypothetical protein [Umezawaea beigongshangensis]|nr:hypothetical protein [Umezawaea beigongshangensis]